jgi:hypothetical protein
VNVRADDVGFMDWSVCVNSSKQGFQHVDNELQVAFRKQWHSVRVVMRGWKGAHYDKTSIACSDS